MEFTCKKIENCFTNSANFQYALEVRAESFMDSIDDWASIRVNEKLRRPTFIGAFAGGIQVKGVLAKNSIRVGYPEDRWEDCKERFEARLAAMDAAEISEDTE
ncbi:MAG: hypothetical protein IKE61_06000 [Coriobacteriales bacterium]|nr:hypothetical protein [Coriobacteriales bacterium]